MHEVNDYLARYRKGDLPDPGIHLDVPFETYRTWPAVNASLLKAAARTAAHALECISGKPKQSKALRFGSFAHAGRLEPLAITERYAVMPDFANDPGNVTDGGKPSSSVQTKWCKQRIGEFALANGGKEIVTQDMYDTFFAMNSRLVNDADAHDLLNAFGPVEVSIVWDDPVTGIRCMARADKLDKRNARVVDYKTCRDLTRFASDIINFGYDLQGAWYADGMGIASGVSHDFAIVAQESAPPHCVQSDVLGEDHITAGRDAYRAALETLTAAVESDSWPGYGAPDWRRPHWAPGQEEEESIGDWLASAAG